MATAADRLASAASRHPRPSARFLAAIAAAGLLLMTLYGLRLVGTASPWSRCPRPSSSPVYLASMIAAARVLRGAARMAAVPAALAVIVMLAYCGWALIVPAVVALAVELARRRPTRLAPP